MPDDFTGGAFAVFASAKQLAGRAGAEAAPRDPSNKHIHVALLGILNDGAPGGFFLGPRMRCQGLVALDLRWSNFATKWRPFLVGMRLPSGVRQHFS